MTAWSLLMPFMPGRPQHVLRPASLVQSGRADRLWHGQSLLVDSYHAFAHMAGSGFRIPVGLGVSLMPLRHPFEAAVQAQSLAVSTAAGVVAGFGPGAPGFQERVLGAPYRSQLGAVREYVTIVRDLLESGRTDRRGEFFDCRADLPVLARPPIEIGLGVLRPGMARLAGGTADVAVTWLTPASYVAEVIVPALEQGAAAAGRARPRIAVTVPVVVEADGRDPLELVQAGSGGHLRMPHYQDMLRRAGVTADPADPLRTAKEALAGGAVLAGSPAEIAAGLREFTDAGVDEVVLDTAGVSQVLGLDAALDDARAVLDVVTT